MRYLIKDREIRTENSAKPISQANRYLTALLLSMPRVDSALDYGCGKLRYSLTLSKRSNSITLVDSEIQLSRLQIVCGQHTTIKRYAQRNLPSARVLSIEEFQEDDRKYDFILCANVLPIVPSEQSRAEIIRSLASKLYPSGKALFTTQFRNSYFRKMMASSEAQPYLDGWLLSTKRGSFFYGLIPMDKLAALISANGFYVQEAWVHGQSAYAWARTYDRNNSE